MRVKIHQCYSKNKFPFNILAILIRKISRTDYSHYAISVPTKSGEAMHFDSTGGGVRCNYGSNFSKRYEIVRSFQCSRDIDYDEFSIWFGQHDGKSYGFGQLVGIMLKMFGLIKKNPFGSGAKRIICNELVILFLNKFYNANIGDTDGLGLNETEKLIKELI